MVEKFAEGRNFHHAVQAFWKTRKVKFIGSRVPRNSCNLKLIFNWGKFE